MYFYELHEGDDEVFGDLLLAHDELFEPDEFFEMVQLIRRRVQDELPHDTLIEAIADGLESEYGFTPIDDDELTRLGPRLDRSTRRTSITPVGRFAPEPEWGEDDDVETTRTTTSEPGHRPSLPDYVTITAELRPDGEPRPN